MTGNPSCRLVGKDNRKISGKIKPMLTEGPYPAHDGKGKDNIGTADASTSGLCITLWQEATTR